MKVLVMGAGGVGGFYAGVLSKYNHDLTIVARGEHAKAIKKNGLQIESANAGRFTAYPKVTDKPTKNNMAELVLFCVKSYDNSAAINLISPAIGPDTTILTLQNGIGSGDKLNEHFGQSKVMLGATYIDGTKKKPGIVEETGNSPNIIFGTQNNKITDKALKILDVFSESNIPIELSDNVMTPLWEKLIYICGWSGMICATRTFFPEILETPEAEEMTLSVLTEAYDVGCRKGANLNKNIIDQILKKFRNVSGKPVSSMFTDLNQGNQLEIEVLNGAVSRIGKEVGLPTPANNFITACLLIADKAARHNR